MLRITVNENPRDGRRNVRLILEGKVVGPWVEELERTWQSLDADNSPSIELDLRSVQYVSYSGKDLLRKMHHAGVKLVAGGLMSREWVDGLLKAVPMLAILLALITGGKAQGQTAAEPLRLSLTDAVNLSLKQNPQVILANLDTDSSRQDAKLARSALLPQLGLSASDTLRRGNVETAFGQSLPGFSQHIGPFYIINGGVSGSVPLFDLTLWHRYRSSQAGVEASRAAQGTEREQATLLVVSQYLGAQRAAADVKAAQSRVDLAQALYEQASDLQKNGVGTGIDTLRANVELQNESQRLIQSRTQFDTSLYSLSRLLGLDATRPIDLTDEMGFSENPEFTAEQSLESAYATRPEMNQIRNRQRAVALERKAAGAQRLPSLNLTGGWAEEGITAGRIIPVYEYGVSLSVPLFTGGRIEAQEAKADIAARQLGEQERDLRNRISVEIKTASRQLEAARNEVRVANAGVDLAREEVTQARDRFQAGVANNIEVITAQDALSRANDNQIAALYRFTQARADLAHATGHIESLYSR